MLSNGHNYNCCTSIDEKPMMEANERSGADLRLKTARFPDAESVRIGKTNGRMRNAIPLTLSVSWWIMKLAKG